MPLTKKTTAKKTSKKVARNVSLKKAKRTRAAGETAAPTKTVKKTSSATSKVVKSKPVKKTTAVKTPRKKSAPTMSIDFQPGTDMYTAFHEVLKGGSSRSEVSARLAAQWENHKTRRGNSKPVSTIMNHVVRRAKANGYTIEQTWRVVPPAGTDVTAINDAQAKEEGSVAPTKKTARKTVKASKKAAPAKAVKKAAKRVAKA